VNNTPIYLTQTGDEYSEEEWVNFTLIHCGPTTFPIIFDNGIPNSFETPPENVKLEMNISELNSLFQVSSTKWDPESNLDSTRSSHKFTTTGYHLLNLSANRIEFFLFPKSNTDLIELTYSTVIGKYRIHIDSINQSKSWNRFELYRCKPDSLVIFNKSPNVHNVTIKLEIEIIDSIGQIEVTYTRDKYFPAARITDSGKYEVTDQGREITLDYGPRDSEIFFSAEKWNITSKGRYYIEDLGFLFKITSFSPIYYVLGFVGLLSVKSLFLRKKRRFFCYIS
jgi:hypothetical protein